MARYLIVDRLGEVPIIHETTAKNIIGAVESLNLEDGDSVEVYRIAAPARKVSVLTERIKKVVVE